MFVYEDINVFFGKFYQFFVFGVDFIINWFSCCWWYNMIVFGINGQYWYINVFQFYFMVIQFKFVFDEFVVLVYIFNEMVVGFFGLCWVVSNLVFYVQEVYQFVFVGYGLGQCYVFMCFIYWFEQVKIGIEEIIGDYVVEVIYNCIYIYIFSLFEEQFFFVIEVNWCDQGDQVFDFFGEQSGINQVESFFLVNVKQVYFSQFVGFVDVIYVVVNIFEDVVFYFFVVVYFSWVVLVDQVNVQFFVNQFMDKVVVWLQVYYFLVVDQGIRNQDRCFGSWFVFL